MTTHDYTGETNPSLAQVDPATASTSPESERAVPQTTVDTTMSPATATDPGWQRQADEFAANRGERASNNQTPVQADSSNSTAASHEGLDEVPRISDVQSSTDTSLFADAELDGLRTRWDDVQAGFVDDPRDCVQKADGLVSDVVRQLVSGFTEARSRLEQQWSRGEEASTEDLRVALKRYREFFDRLLAV